MRRAEPFRPVDGVAKPGVVALAVERPERAHVAGIVARIEGEGRKIGPAVRIADLRPHALELGQRGAPGFRVHPVRSLEARTEGGLQVGDHVQCTRLGIGGQMRVDEQLTHGEVGGAAVERVQHLLPAFGLCRHPAHGLRVKNEMLLRECRGQVGCGAVEQAGAQVRAPCRQRGLRQLLVEFAEESRLRQRQLGDVAMAVPGQEAVPVDARRDLSDFAELAHGEDVVQVA